MHHPRIDVVLELQEVVGRIPQDDGGVLLDEACEAGDGLPERGQFSQLHQAEERIEIAPVVKGDSEVPGIQIKIVGLDWNGLRHQVTDELVAEEVDRDAVVVPAGEMAAQPLDVEPKGRIQVV